MVRSFYRESSKYGFTQLDYVRFVNMLLDLSMQSQDSRNGGPNHREGPGLLDQEEDANFNELPIWSERIKIRKFDRDRDIEVMKEWLEDNYGRRFFLSRTTAQTIDLETITSDHWNLFGIITTHEDIPVGCVAYLGFNSEQKKAELRKLIGDPAMRGRGLAKEATRLWIRYGIKGLKLKKIYLSTLNTDIRNIRLNEALGFKVEGILRNEICVAGVYHDILRMGLWTG